MALLRRRQRYSLTNAGWWSRLIVAALFAFYLNSIPFHLATAAHQGGVRESVTEAVLHHHGHGAADQSHESDHHVPHPAADHAVDLTTDLRESNTLVLVVLFLPLNASAILEESTFQPPIPVLERIDPPGASPPDPQQPRAPPLA